MRCCRRCLHAPSFETYDSDHVAVFCTAKSTRDFIHQMPSCPPLFIALLFVLLAASIARESRASFLPSLASVGFPPCGEQCSSGTSNCFVFCMLLQQFACIRLFVAYSKCKIALQSNRLASPNFRPIVGFAESSCGNAGIRLANSNDVVGGETSCSALQLLLNAIFNPPNPPQFTLSLCSHRLLLRRRHLLPNVGYCYDVGAKPGQRCEASIASRVSIALNFPNHRFAPLNSKTCAAKSFYSL
jgi:hypothetical protein